MVMAEEAPIRRAPSRTAAVLCEGAIVASTLNAPLSARGIEASIATVRKDLREQRAHPRPESQD